MKKLLLLITSIIFSSNSNAATPNSKVKSKSLFNKLSDAKVVTTETASTTGRTGGGGGNVGPKF